jgi:hypothetical protein
MSKKNKFSGLLSQAIEQKTNQELDIRNQITVLPELKALIPSLSVEEYNLLETSLLTEGCREALMVWENNKEYILIDGHNRYEICQKYQLSFKYQLKQFDNFEEVKNWMINNQLGKRNLTEQQKSYLRGIRYQSEKRNVGGTGKNQYSNDDNLTALRTSEKLGELYQVSPKTIERDEKFALGLDILVEDDVKLKNQILSKQIKIPAGVIQKLADKDAEQRSKIKTEIQNQYISELPKIKSEETLEISLEASLQKQISTIIKKMSEEKLKKLLEYLNADA